MRPLFYLLFLIFICTACIDNRECSSPSDCEGRSHDECYGDWMCRNGLCAWLCMNPPVEENVSVPITNVSEPECVNNSDCIIGGCNGQLCGIPEEINNLFTNCEWELRYECLKRTTCDCINGSCGWRINDEYFECMGEYEENISRFTCVFNGDCIPAECCHPTYCINVEYVPDCSGVNCTETCETVLDCDSGVCICFEGECMVRRSTSV